MKRYRKGQIYKPPSAADSSAQADAIESRRRSPAKPQDYPPRGQIIEVKTPDEGIPACDGNTISWAWCERCIHIDGTEVNAAGGTTKTRVDTDETLPVYNLLVHSIPSNSYVLTALTDTGVRCVLPQTAIELWRFSLNEAFSGSPSRANADLLSLAGIDTGEDVELYDYLDVFSADLSTNDVGYCIKQNGVYVAIQAPCPPEA